MKYFVAFLALAALASAVPFRRPSVGTLDPNVQAIIDAINHPSTDPGTAALLWDQLESILNAGKPEDSPISGGPAIVEEEIVPSPVQVIESEDAAPKPALVQVIVNVNPNIPGLVSVEQVQPEIVPTPVIVVDKPEPEIEPTPVIVVDKPEPEIEPTPVIVVDEPQPAPEPVLIAPIITPPVSVGPVVVHPLPQ